MQACSPQSSDSPGSADHSRTTEHGAGPVHWDYGEEDGPANWAALSSDYVTCASGREQSPIDIAGATTGEPRQMNKDYVDVPLSESNVSLKLADIQKRCSQLISDPDEFDGLSLEDSATAADESNPYNRG